MKPVDGIITVKWSYSRDGQYPYCNRSRRFQVGVKSYSSYAAATSSSGTPVRYYDVKRRLSEYNFTDLSVHKYHRFFVRALKGEYGQGPTPSVKSPLQFLSDSGKLVGAIVFLHFISHNAQSRTLITGEIESSVPQS